jgi:hypothetical protein
MNYTTGVQSLPPAQTGGGTNDGTLYTFTSNGTLTLYSDTVCDMLIVAGGGGGGGTDDRTGGGGGAGGVTYLQSVTLTTGTYDVFVGTGGTGGTNGFNGSNGGNSSLELQFSYLIYGAQGGGGGVGLSGTIGNYGGSGGGGNHNDGSYGGSSVSGQGYNGGSGGYSAASPTGSFAGGGGGGAGAAALDVGFYSIYNGPTAGGIGIQNSITGSLVYYSGGGGGSVNNCGGQSFVGAPGGIGGGGSGATTNGPNNSPTNVSGGNATYYGGGGGGSAGNSGGSSVPCKGGDGYQGIVIIKMISRIEPSVTQYINGIYVESLNILRISNELSGLMYGVTDTSNYPAVTSLLTNPQVSGVTYLFDQIPQTVSGMLCFYSMRTVSFSYTGPVIRLRNEITDFEDDFYSDTTQSFLRTSNGTSINDQNIYRVVIWYDQTINGNNLVQSVKVAQPRLFRDPSGNSGNYVVAILNNTNNFDYVNPSFWMDLSKPIHPQQFIMTMKLNSIGSYFNPISIFSSKKTDFRISGGNMYGNYGAGDWAYLPNGGNTYFTVDGAYNGNIYDTNRWYNITSWKTGVYSGSDMTTIGIPSPGFYQIPSRSMNGYFYELGFMKQMTLSSESTGYYDNRPPL